MGFFATLWDWIWFSVMLFAFIAYLWVLISIVIDIFRDHSLNGWLKAVWLICLLIFPFITGLVYVIARGRGMAERSVRQQQEYQEYSKDYIRSVSFASPADEIAKAKDLLDQGVISQGEYDALKNKALGGTY
ncbi:SHOCT domain-containing protein [Agromyces sp. LHK192]|uniref:SHOCT domain-containing protein n=1 Tax=Agromyces sp. LHK192 TaxID=2498704 RepID=UPI000FD751EF|nr:SHOCT domain-containing protein [Agromyces sp. LHK192]